MSIRSFSLNSPEAYEALGGRSDRPWIPNGALPRERASTESLGGFSSAALWPRGESSVSVRAETDDEAEDAFREWQRHVEAGRIGGES
jgi:hypothetical protein